MFAALRTKRTTGGGNIRHLCNSFVRIPCTEHQNGSRKASESPQGGLGKLPRSPTLALTWLVAKEGQCDNWDAMKRSLI